MTGLRVANCESGLNPSIIGDTTLTFDGGTYGYSVGVMQIRELPGRPSKEWLLNPINNIAYAKEMMQKQGWYPWSCYHMVL